MWRSLINWKAVFYKEHWRSYPVNNSVIIRGWINSFFFLNYFGEIHSFTPHGYTCAMYIEWCYAIKPIGEVRLSKQNEYHFAHCVLLTVSLLQTFREFKSRLRLSIVSEYVPKSYPPFKRADSKNICHCLIVTDKEAIFLQICLELVYIQQY
jgi:hypothetical protein